MFLDLCVLASAAADELVVAWCGGLRNLELFDGAGTRTEVSAPHGL